MSANVEPIPLASPELGEREEELVLEVLRSGRLSLGPMGERFERAFAAFLGVDDAVAVSSGTAALHLGVRQLGWGSGDEVLTSPFTFVASAILTWFIGARPAVAAGSTVDASAAGAAPVPVRRQPIKRLALLYTAGNANLMVSNVILTTIVLQHWKQSP